ncbi:ribonuclease H-like domain-containing protein [Mycena maculata]|uniref:Ribonuclease H-like domain-containing protein n=1 Tax=Mycena maculata TaxID=230809 RepID=A0AAD7IWD8_9AGAR|nr:ribonuclease H-like domain-containing protein [Mycena maculata]
MADPAWTGNALGLKYFHKGSEMANGSHWKTYCKGCVGPHLKDIKEARVNAGIPVDAATRLIQENEDMALACAAVGFLRGEKSVWITHVLGSKNGRTLPCLFASPGATAEAKRQRSEAEVAKGKAPSVKHARSASTTESNDARAPKKLKQSMLKTYMGHDMPFSSSEADAIESQALRAIVSTNSAFGLFEDPEMLTLFGMMRSRAPEIIPSGKVIGGRLLNEAASTVEEKLSKVLTGQMIGLSADGWKALTKASVNGVCANVDYKASDIQIDSYTIELVDVTSMDKSGPGMCRQFAEIIDRIETKYGCIIIYFITDADGGSKKGRVLLGKERRYLILPSCWAHQFQLILGDYFKVHKFAAATAETATALIGWINNHGKLRKIFDSTQEHVSKDCLNRVLVISYLVANLTRWTTHCIAFMRLLRLQEALQWGVMGSRGAIIAAQVGAAKGAEKIAFTEEAERYCTLIQDPTFWSSLESLIEDIEPICYGTNINQKDSTRADQVLLSLVGMFLRMADHPEPDVAAGMTARLEKRWKDCDQPLFLLALILNPFEQLSCFGPDAGLNHFNCLDLLVSMYQRMKSRPDNKDTDAQRKAKEERLSAAFLKYLSGTGTFAAWKGSEDLFEKRMGRDPIAVWVALSTPEIAELADFAIMILKIVVNQAGCEQVFSDLKVKQTQRRNRLKLEKLDKMTKIGADLKTDHQERGLIKLRNPRQVHKSTDALLTVPRYRDLIQDQDIDDSDSGPSVISTAAGLRGVMNQWISDARAEEEAEAEAAKVKAVKVAAALKSGSEAPVDSDSSDDETTARISFLVLLKKHAERLSQEEIDAEAVLMKGLADAERHAEAEEDARLDDGAVEIPSEDEYVG